MRFTILDIHDHVTVFCPLPGNMGKYIIVDILMITFTSGHILGYSFLILISVIILSLALGNSPGTSSSSPVGGRLLFSSVTRLGFAAAHDSPSLRIEETGSVHSNEVKSDLSGVNGTPLMPYFCS